MIKIERMRKALGKGCAGYRRQKRRVEESLHTEYKLFISGVMFVRAYDDYDVLMLQLYKLWHTIYEVVVMLFGLTLCAIGKFFLSFCGCWQS